MHTEVITKRTGQLFELAFLKSHLNISTKDHDVLLTYLMTVATDWVENQLGKTFLTQILKVTHNNNCFALPFGPVQEVIKVIYNKQELGPNNYVVDPEGDSLKITVPFRWKTTMVEVTYKAGYGVEADRVPSALRHAVLGTIEYLYNNKGDLRTLNDQTAPWLRAYRCYRIVGS